MDSIDKIPFSQTRTIETPLEELTTGTTFANRYQIIEQLGAGGMGRVYRALDKELEEEVALKLIKPEIASDSKTIERFRNELKIARKISHRNIGRMYELLEDRGTRYITMEYVPGGDLKKFIRRVGQLPSGKAISIAKQICEGLKEAHSLGIVHRDLKPNNIMIDDEGNARIMDFGIARTVKGKGITDANLMIGTPEYMSPEQVEAKDIDQRSDIYSFGIVLYEMLTGQVPFQGDSPFAIGVKHKSEIPKDPKDLNSQIPEDLNQLILRCLQKDRELRYANAEKILSELEKIEGDFPSTEKSVSANKSQTSKEITVTFGIKKKIFIPALIFVVLAAAAILIWRTVPRKKILLPVRKMHSIAVLPFEDMSPDKDQEYFCDGMADEIINTLSNIEDLHVIARTSAFAFKGKNEDVREIGRKLNVENLLEGSVRKAGNQLRVVVRLVRTSDGMQLWSQRYDRNLTDVFAIQDSIALGIVNYLKITLLGREEARIAMRFTDNLEAFNQYLKGRLFLNRRKKEDIFTAISYFERALELDPNYVMGYIGLADAYALLPFYASEEPGIAFPKAKEAVFKALKINDQIGEAYASLGWIRILADWDWEGAEEALRKAVELNPGYATVFHWLGYLYMYLGHFDKSIPLVARALELDPLSPIINRVIGDVYYQARHYDKAISALNKTVELEPCVPFSHLVLSNCYRQKALYEEAIEELLKERECRKNNSYGEDQLGVIYAVMGNTERASQILEKLRVEGGGSPLAMSQLCFALGKNDLGFEILEEMYQNRNVWTHMINIIPVFDPVREDPRFQALLKKIGF